MTKDLEKNTANPVIYEVNISIKTQHKITLFEWLQEHIQDMLSLPGFIRAELMHDNTADSATECSATVHYHLKDQPSLDRYLSRYAPTMRQQGIDQFGAQMTVTRRILTPSKDFTANATMASPKSLCMNCDTPLSDAFCQVCGQKKQRRIVSIPSIISDFFGGMFNWDSRFWHTIIPLMSRPGLLTKTFLDGKRERFIPPIRMYLVTSVIFFLMISLQSRVALMQVDTAAPLISGTAISSSDLKQQDATEKDDTTSASIKNTKINENCNWLLFPERQSAFYDALRQRARDVCSILNTRQGQVTFAQELLGNLPLVLLILLPIMAFIQLFFYPFSKRYYVEHLLFYVHNYSFIFIFATIITGITLFLQRINVSSGWFTALSIIYVMYYFIRSMRVVYQQSKLITFLKWLSINCLFFVLAVVVLTFISIATAAFLV